MGNIVVNITGNKEIQAPVAIVIAERRTGGPVAYGYARLFRNIV
jgi:hypothetical protein